MAKIATVIISCRVNVPFPACRPTCCNSNSATRQEMMTVAIFAIQSVHHVAEFYFSESEADEKRDKKALAVVSLVGAILRDEVQPSDEKFSDEIQEVYEAYEKLKIEHRPLLEEIDGAVGRLFDARSADNIDYAVGLWNTAVSASLYSTKTEYQEGHLQEEQDATAQTAIAMARLIGAKSAREAAEITLGHPMTDDEWMKCQEPWERNWKS